MKRLVRPRHPASFSSRALSLTATGTLAAALAFAAPSTQAQLTVSGGPVSTPIAIKISPLPTPHPIPQTVFGSFLEPIGHSTYGGLWADVVENPSFENGLWSAENVDKMVKEQPSLAAASALGIPLPWQPLEPNQGARYVPERATPSHPVANSLQALLVMGLPGKEVGVRQRVYLPVHRELTYQGSLWVKAVQGPDPNRPSPRLVVSLRRHDQPETILAQAALTATGAAWTKLPFTLTLQPGAVQPLEPVDLAVSLPGDSRVELDDVHLFPADALDGLDPDEVALARDSHSPLIRFGGNFTSGYDWHDGIGPQDKRPSLRNVSWGIPEYNTFGTDEFLHFCSLIHAEPQVALNLGSGTAEDAADWVRYIDRKQGHGGLLWELGNELWGDWQVGQRTESFSKAVRAVDPQARLIATGEEPVRYQDWDAAQLQDPKGTFEYISTHYVVGDGVQLPHPPPDFNTLAALALPIGLEPLVRATQQQAADAGHPEVKVAFTEWLLISRDHTGPNFTNLGGALFAGGFLNMILRNSDVAPISDMTGIMEFGGIWKKRGQVYAAPAYWVLRTYATAAPKTLLLATATSAPVYSVTQGNRQLATIPNVPYLDVTAALSGDSHHLLLFCVNRNLTDALTAHFDLSALAGKPTGTAQVSTLRSESILSVNDEEEPNHILPAATTEPAETALQHRFPAASVTVLTIPLTQ